LYDIGAVPNAEPYAKRLHHGVILGPDGRKMSKSWGNVVNPDQVVSKYGADVVRLYMMFIGPYDSVTPWSDKAINGVYRFVGKLYEMLQEKIEMVKAQSGEQTTSTAIAKLAHKIAHDVEKLKFNTVVSSLMEFYNKESRNIWSSDDVKIFLQLIAPFAPYLAEEMWQKMDMQGSVHEQAWPDTSYVATVDTIEIPVMINGKVRARMTVKVDESQEQVVSVALNITEVQKNLPEGHKKVVYVPGKTVNFVA
jgi:leucyl-tRNA synthetase